MFNRKEVKEIISEQLSVSKDDLEDRSHFRVCWGFINWPVSATKLLLFRWRMDHLAKAKFNIIRLILATYWHVRLKEQIPQQTLIDDLGADSLDVVQLIMTLEETFDIEIPDEDIEDMRYVGELMNYLEENITDQ